MSASIVHRDRAHAVNRAFTHANANESDVASPRASRVASPSTGSQRLPTAIDRAIALARSRADEAERQLAGKLTRAMRDLTNAKQTQGKMMMDGGAGGKTNARASEKATTSVTSMNDDGEERREITREQESESANARATEKSRGPMRTREWMDDVVRRAKAEAADVERAGGRMPSAQRAASTVAAVMSATNKEYLISSPRARARDGRSPGSGGDLDMAEAEAEATPRAAVGAVSPRFRASDVDEIKATLRTDYENAMALMRERAEAAEREVGTLTTRCAELENGRRSARNALAEMASQNAKLVSAFTAKKDEVRALKESMETSALDAEVMARGIEAQKALDATRVELSACKAAAAARENEFAKAQAELATLRAQAHAAAKNEGAHDAEVSELRAKVEAVTAALEREREAFASSRASWKSERAKLVNIASDNEPKPTETVEQPMKASPSKRGASASPRRLLKTPTKEHSPRGVGKANHRCALRDEAERLKVLGNQQFHAKAFEAALQSYADALAVEFNDEPFRAVLHANKAAALQAMGKFCDAVLECCISRTFDDTYIRALQRRADAYLSMGDWPMAMKDLEELTPHMGEDCAAKLSEARRKVNNGGTTCEHYAVLGVSSRAQRADIIKAYKHLALKFHPDKAPSDAVRPASEALFKRVAEAYAVLKDDAARAQYDASIVAARFRRTYTM